MTRPRTPNTCGHAILRIVVQIGGFDAAAAIVGRRPSCVRDWGNEATTSCPSWAQAIALDAAYRAAGGEGAPLYEAYGAQLDLTVSRLTACHAELASDLADTLSEFGDAASATARLTIPGCTPHQVQAAIIEIDQAETRLTRLRRRVMSFVKPGAGPGMPGGYQ